MILRRWSSSFIKQSPPIRSPQQTEGWSFKRGEDNGQLKTQLAAAFNSIDEWPDSRKYAKSQWIKFPFHFLKKSQIEPIITAASTIIFPESKNFCFTRQKDKELFRIIFYTPTRLPRIFSGVFTDVDLLNKMRAYYYLPEDTKELKKEWTELVIT